jgi:hypothetical protein
MFSTFKSHFEFYSQITNKLFDIKEIPFKYSELLLDLGGYSFNKGLYTIHTFESSLKWADLLSKYFPGYKNEILPFAFDWCGRQFCVARKGYEGIYVFDPSDLQDLFSDENLLDFHNITLVDDSGILINNYFQEALEVLNLNGLNSNQCVCYKLPLFLNGKDDSSNYEIIDTEVYWETQHQIFNQIKDLPEGTRISNIAIVPQFKYDNKNKLE